MPIGRALESATVSLLLNKMASKQVLDFFVKWEIDKTLLTKLKTNLLATEALLDHAEEKQIDDRNVKEWLDEVRVAVLDAEDLLDAIATAALESRNGTNKVRDFFFDLFGSGDSVREKVDYKVSDALDIFNPFKERLETNIKEMIGRLEDFAKQKDILRLREGKSESVKERLPTTPLVTQSHVYGRDEDKRNIIEVLVWPRAGKSDDQREQSSDFGRVKMYLAEATYEKLKRVFEVFQFLLMSFSFMRNILEKFGWTRVQNSSHVSSTHDGKVRVVPIVGMGGIGKTTLAQIVYNDVNVRKGFDFKAWACVSDVFDVTGITRALIESATGRTFEMKNLELLQKKLKDILHRKKFLIVLDDVWNERFGDWDSLQIPFVAGAPGSSIIVTTRSKDVASMMGTVPTYNLGEMSNNDCLLLLEQTAFTNGDFNSHPKLKSIGQEMVKKCKGLPLAAKALGGLLRSNEPCEDEWKAILHSEIWDSRNCDVLPALRLSYHHLPTHLKKCFSFCSIFPKDYKFEMHKLVLLWMAEGFISDQENECFSGLVARSFFQQDNNEKSKFVMHDLIHDLAQIVSGKLFIRLEDRAKVAVQSNSFDKARHLSYIRGDDSFFKFELFNESRHLRTFLPLDPTVGVTYNELSSKVYRELLPKFKFIRVLSLSYYLITELPDSIGDLIHLRYLDVSQSKIKQLPESTSSLFHLQSLILHNCSYLTKLPDNMGRLIELRHLDISKSSLAKMPSGMGRLTLLQTLTDFIVGAENTGSSIGELKDLSSIRGSLSISGLNNISNINDAIEANLRTKTYLDDLVLEWSNTTNDLESEPILDALQPPESLKKLTIEYYNGESFPGWMGDSQFANIVLLKLSRCLKCKSLPPVGQLPSVKDIIIEGMDSIRCVGREFYGECASNTPFRSLETLLFKDMKEWWNWSNVGDGLELFPCLRELSITNCPKLTQLSLHFASLEKLQIRRCDDMTAISVSTSTNNLNFAELPRLALLRIISCTRLRKLPNSLPSLKALMLDCSKEIAILPRLEELQHLNLLGSNKEAVESLANLDSLTMLQLSDISFMTNLPEGFFRRSTLLEKLKISGCGNLVGLSNDQDILGHLSSLRHLTISKCPELTVLSDGELPPILEVLHLIKCDQLSRLPLKLHSLKFLRELRVEGCKNLKSFPNKGLPFMLKHLEIKDCADLVTLPEGLLCDDNTLEHLVIHRCRNLLSFLGRGCVFRTLKQFQINDCQSLKVLPEALMHKDRMSLEYLEIDGCGSLETFPEGELPAKLNRICIVSCTELRSLPMSLLTLKFLDLLEISKCPHLEKFPYGKMETANLRSFGIDGCDNLISLPDGLHKLGCLRELSISGCSRLQSFPEGGLPVKLRTLAITDCRLLNPTREWKLHFLDSLETLLIGGCDSHISLSSVYLPSSITTLHIRELPNLKYLSEGLEHLKSLERLFITSCEQLQSLPNEGLLSKLSRLSIQDCPHLMQLYAPETGRDRKKIADIPFVTIS